MNAEDKLMVILTFFLIIGVTLGSYVYWAKPVYTYQITEHNSSLIYYDYTAPVTSQPVINNWIGLPYVNSTKTNPCEFYANQHSDCFMFNGTYCGNCNG